MKLFDDITFLDQIMGDLDSGDLFKRLGQDLGFILVSRDGLRHDLDVHPHKGFGRLDEPFHFFHLFCLAQSRGLKFFIDPLLGGCHVRARSTCKKRE